MVNASNSDKPALSVCISEIESLYGSQKIFDLEDDFVKQSVGAMVKVVLAPFAYVPYKSKKFQQGISTFIRSASVYHRRIQSPRLKIVQKLSVEMVSDEK